MRVIARNIWLLFLPGLLSVALAPSAGAVPSGRTVTAAGQPGQVTCAPTGGQTFDSLTLAATKSMGQVSGSADIGGPGGATETLVNLTSGHISKSSFTFGGTVLPSSFCNVVAIPVGTAATFSGTCGPSAPVNYSDAAGDSASWTADVTCT